MQIFGSTRGSCVPRPADATIRRHRSMWLPRLTVIGRVENPYGTGIAACGLTLRLEFANSDQLNYPSARTTK